MNAIAQVSENRTETRPVPVRRHPCLEHYDALLRRLQAADNGTPAPQIVGVTSCARRAGVSTIAANVAIRAADRGDGPVLLVDGNTQHPALDRMLQIGSGPGLINAAAGSAKLADCMVPCDVEGLCVLRAGNGGASASALAESFQAMRNQFRLIVVDLPPADELSPLWDLSGQLDGVLLVIEAEKTRSGAAQRVRRQLAECHVPLLGVVLNKRRTYVPDWLYRLM